MLNILTFIKYILRASPSAAGPYYYAGGWRTWCKLTTGRLVAYRSQNIKLLAEKRPKSDVLEGLGLYFGDFKGSGDTLEDHRVSLGGQVASQGEIVSKLEVNGYP